MPRDPAADARGLPAGTRRHAAALACLLAACSPPAGGPACPHEGRPDRAALVSVTHAPLKAVVRRDLGLAEIAGLAGGMGAGLQGLTVVEHSFERKWTRTLAASSKPGRSCVWLTRLTVDLTPAKAEIYIPREYPDGSCEAEEVAKHERDHEEVHRSALESFSVRLAAAFAAADWLPVRGAPLEVSGEKEADERLEDAFERIMAPERRRFLDEMRERNAVLDIPENYRWVTARCRGWKAPRGGS